MGFAGVLAKHLRRGSGWQPRNMRVSAMSESVGQSEKGV